MDPRDEVIALETEGWQALSADAGAATAFYGGVLDETVAFHQQTPR